MICKVFEKGKLELDFRGVWGRNPVKPKASSNRFDAVSSNKLDFLNKLIIKLEIVATPCTYAAWVEQKQKPRFSIRATPIP